MSQVSGLEMAQNGTMSTWTAEVVDTRLKEIMKSIYAAASGAAKEYGVTLQVCVPVVPHAYTAGLAGYTYDAGPPDPSSAVCCTITIERPF